MTQTSDQVFLQTLQYLAHFSELNYKATVETQIRQILAEPRYQDHRRLEKYGFKAYSQSDEDGIIEEIFRRVRTTNAVFVEFGVGHGLENNTVYLLYKNWSGLWIEGSTEYTSFISSKFAPLLASSKLKLARQFITAENINEIISSNGIHGEIDLLSIDVDGNDFYIWKAIEVISPRVVVIEYNAKFRPPVTWVMEYNPNHVWDKTDYFGSSLKALEALGNIKGYRLVGCNLTGTNAFFVREDLVEDRFEEPFTSENFYQPPRYYMISAYSSAGGHPPSFDKQLRLS